MFQNSQLNKDKILSEINEIRKKERENFLKQINICLAEARLIVGFSEKEIVDKKNV